MVPQQKPSHSTLVDLITTTCIQKHRLRGLQLTVVSAGIDVDAIIASLAEHCLRALKASPLSAGRTMSAHDVFFVIVPDAVDCRLIYSLGDSIRNASQWQQLHTPWTAASKIHVHCVVEGTSPKQRADAYLQGGVVVISARFFCADCLHQRVSLHQNLAGAVCFLPNSLRSRMSLRKSSRGLFSLAFAVELMLTRNYALQRAHNALQLQRRDLPDSASSILAPLYLLCDDVHIVRHCTRSRTALDEISFLKAFHVDDIEVFPRFRLDVVEHFEKKHALNASVSSSNKNLQLLVEEFPTRTPPSAIALDRILTSIVEEVLAELKSLEKRCVGTVKAAASDADPSQKHASTTKGRRVEGGADGLWHDDSKPCKISFAHLRLSDLRDASKNGLDVLFRDATTSKSLLVAPYVKLIESLLDLQYLLDLLHAHCSPALFLFALEEVVSLPTKWLRSGTRGEGELSELRPLWTLSDKFGDVLVLANHRVYEVQQPTISTAHMDEGHVILDSDSEDSEVLIVERPAMPLDQRPPTTIVPSSEEADEVLSSLKRLASSWISTMQRKAKRRQQNEKRERDVVVVDLEVEEEEPARRDEIPASIPTQHPAWTHPSLLIITDTDSNMKRLAWFLLMSRSEFAQFELERFIFQYQRLHGAACSTHTHKQHGRGNHMLPSYHHKKTKYSSGGVLKENILDDGGDESDTERFRDGDEENHMTMTEDTDLDIVDVASRMLVMSQQQQQAQGRSAGGGRSAAHHGQHINAPSEPSSQSLTGSAHQLLLSQTVSSQAWMSDEELSRLCVTRSSQQIVEDTVAYQLVGLGEGTAVLRASSLNHNQAAETSSTNTTMIRIVSSRSLTNQDLIQFMVGGMNATSTDWPHWRTTRTWDHNSSLVPPVGRVLVAQPELKTLRMLEGLEDAMNHSSSMIGLGLLKVQLIVAADGWDTSKREEELLLERNSFHDVILAKAALTESEFCSADAIGETERQLRSGLVGGGSSPEVDASSLLRMTIRLREEKIKSKVPTPSTSSMSGVRAATQQETTKPLVVFDEREFRCSLPYQLYCRGFEILPLTLLQGDYIIAANYAVERKAPADLLQSLQSGRLATQLRALSKTFLHPILLIEFARSSTFRLFPPSTSTLSSSSLSPKFMFERQRLSALLAEFPGVHVMWSRSSHHSAAMLMKIRNSFQDAAQNVDPGDPSLTQKKEGETAACLLAATNILRSFPGVDVNNVGRLMNTAGSLAGLGSLSLQTLSSVMGVERGKQLYDFLHKPIIESIA